MQQEPATGRVRRFWRPSARTLAVGLLLAATPACRQPEPAPPPDRVTLKIGVALPDAAQSSTVDNIAETLSSEQLVSIGFDGRPQAGLAQSWEPLPGGLGVRLKLRPRVLFHNGQPGDAPSVARILRSQIALFERGGWNVAGSIKDIRPTSGDEIEIRYRRRDAFVLPDLGIFSIADPKDPLLRTGPFQLKPDNPPGSLAAFDGYYLGRPSIDAIQLQPYGTQRKAWIAMMRGEVNALYEVSREATDFVEAETAIRSYPFLRAYHLALVFNQAHPTLASRDVRVALNEAVDRDAIVRDGMRGRALPADGPIWPYHWAYSSAQRTFAHNPDAARLRLDRAGLTENRDGGPGRMRSRFHFTCLVPSDDTRFERIALIVQRQLFEVGVDMEIQALPVGEMIKSRVRKGEFDAFLFEMTSGRTLSWLYRFWHSPSEGPPPALRTGYRGADGALDRLRGAQSDDETRLAVSDLQRVMYEDPPAVFLVWPRETRAADARFRVPYLNDRDVLTGVRDWRLIAPVVKASR
jgi:peptide/nickel transport system substrate-binding protein